jgi:predicted nuclease of restriction endonuclease-like (RecB) superfamily
MKTELAERIEQLITEAKKRTISAVNTAMVYTYYEIGRMIVDDEQQGEERAKYGKAVLKELSIRLTNKFGKGFSVDNLENMRRFYLIYSNSETLSRNLAFTLSWSHYLKLMRIDNPEERSFYEIEAKENNWSLRQLLKIPHFGMIEGRSLKLLHS